MKTVVIHKNIFKISSKGYFVKNIKFFLLFIIDFVTSGAIINLVNIDNLLIWFIVFTLFTIINAFLVLLAFMGLKEAKFMNRLKFLMRRG